MLQLHTFGGLRIERDGQALQLSTHKARALLAYLIVFRQCSHPRSVVAGTLWPDLAEDKARRHLSDTLWRVRSVLGDCVVADEECVCLNLSQPCWLDVQEFEDGLQAARSESQIAVSLASRLAACTELYRGPFLDGLYDDWALAEQERLRVLYLEALQRLLELRKQAADYLSALEIARRLVAAEPLHEAAHRELMCLYHLLGREAEAVAQYLRCREILRRELKEVPAPETEALYQTLSRAALPAEVQAVHLPASARGPVATLEEPPLVGRDAQRAVLLNHLETAASGQGELVLLEGEAGIGKTRLARELVAGSGWRNICTVVASAGQTDMPSSYSLLLAALRPLLSPLRIRQLAGSLEPVHFQAAALLLPCLSGALSDRPPLPDLPPPQAWERIQQALIAFVLGLARITPHLWVLEDLQWADAETLSLLPLLLPRLAESRTLFLLTGRSADLRANLLVWNALQALDRAGPFPRYTLARLGADDVGSLVRTLLGQEQIALTEHLARESEGVPLYLVEILKTWRDEGHLAPTERGTWQWRGDMPVAHSAYLGQAVIGYRVASLTYAAGEVLSAAAVIGVEVDFDLLGRMCALPDALSDHPRLLTATDELLRLGFLIETDIGYRFSHEQVRQAVYHRLSSTERQHLHRKAALAAQTLFPTQFELLAHHFAAAGEQEPAIHYLTRAAERARQVFAHQAALSCYERLLGLIHSQDYAARYDVLRDHAETLGWMGDRTAQGRDLEEILSLAQSFSDDARLARALHMRSEWHRLQGRHQPAEGDALAALEIYRQLRDDRAQAALLSQLGYTVIYTNDSSRASTYFQAALPIYQALGDFQGQIDCLAGLVSTAESDGDYFLALSYLQQNMALAEATGDARRISRGLHNMGVIHYDLGDMDAAEAFLRRALQLKETTGDRHSQAFTYFYLSVVSIERGDLQTAQAHLDTALEIFRQVQDVSYEGDGLFALGQLALLRNDPPSAVEHLRASCRRRRELGEPAYAVIDLSYLALAELAWGDQVTAWQHSQEAVTEFQAGLAGVEHPQRIFYNHFCVAEATRHWAAARVTLEEAARIVDERAEHISAPALREKYRAGHRINRAIAGAIADQPPPGCLRVRLPRAEAPGHRRSASDEVVALTWTVEAGEADTALAEREGKVALRRHRLNRLLAEAEAAGATPAIADLAGALDVSPRTIRTDLAALKRQGHAVRTLGGRA